MEALNLKHQTFDRLTVVQRIQNNIGERTKWLCYCNCGNTSIISTSDLTTGHTRSCGCLCKERTSQAKTTHGMSHSSEYYIWSSMKDRCLNKNNHAYPIYGGRGVTVCERWLKFENFYADMGDRPDGLTLDRRNNDAGYSPSNCRWATRIEQARNQRLRKTNKSGVKGVSMQDGKWRTRIKVGDKLLSVYYGPSFKKACTARKSSELKFW